MSHRLQFEMLGDILVVHLPEEYSLQSAAQQVLAEIENLEQEDEIGILMDPTGSASARDLDSIREAFVHWQPLQHRVARFAVLVKSDLHWALTRQVSVFAEIEGFEIRPFKDQAEAIAWLSQAGQAQS